MMDEIFDRNYQKGRKELHGGLERAFRSLASEFGKSFDALHRLEWSAPWNTPNRRPQTRDIGCA